jgi:3-hydroxybutyryl-CoA dehydratase
MNDSNGYDVEDLRAGMTASFSRTIRDADIHAYAALSGDDNPVHVDEAFAASSVFRGRVVHGFFVASLISAAVSRKLPGPGSVYLNQQLRFLAPVRPGDTVLATVTVKQTDPTSSQVVLETVCRVGEQVVVDGQATVLATSSVRRARRFVPEADGAEQASRSR